MPNKIYSNVVPDPTVFPVPIVDAAVAHGKLKHIVDSIELPTGLGAGDLVQLGSIPSNATLSSLSFFENDALGSITVNVGDTEDPNGLVAAQSVSVAGSFGAMKAVDRSKYGKRLWEILGYTKDPLKPIDLELVLIAAPTAAGTLTWEIIYSVD